MRPPDLQSELLGHTAAEWQGLEVTSRDSWSKLPAKVGLPSVTLEVMRFSRLCILTLYSPAHGQPILRAAS